MLDDTEARQQWLKKTYSFECACALCTAPPQGCPELAEPHNKSAISPTDPRVETGAEANELVRRFNERFRCLHKCGGLIFPVRGADPPTSV
ncbi:MAG: hypothetical protein ACPIOQ_31670, partial [Promethearchaeia archaeon]